MLVLGILPRFIKEMTEFLRNSDLFIITTIAGIGIYGYSGDGGPASESGIAAPLDVVVDSNKNIYFIDGEVRRYIRKIDVDGIIITIAERVFQHIAVMADRQPQRVCTLQVWRLILTGMFTLQIISEVEKLIQTG